MARLSPILKRAFNLFDANHSGFIDPIEFKIMLAKLQCVFRVVAGSSCLVCAAVHLLGLAAAASTFTNARETSVPMPSRGSILLADDRTGWGAHGTLQYDPSRRAIRDRPHVPVGRCRQQRRDQLSRVHRPHHILRGRDGLATDLPGATWRDRRERDRDDEAYKQM